MFQTFGGGPVSAALASYLSLALTGNTALTWPDFVSVSGQNAAAFIIDLNASGPGFALSLPNATQVGVGSTIMFNNVGANSVNVNDFQGNTIATVAPGVVQFLYLYNNAATGGSWRVFTFGTGTSAANASSLAGFGLQVTGSTLSQSHPANDKATTWTVDATGLAQFFVLTGGTSICNLPTSASIGANFFFFVKNGGSGTLTLTPSGADTIDGAASIQLAPNDACVVFSDGAQNRWWTVGIGRNINFAFTQLVKNVAGNTDVTLTSTEAGNKLMTFTGALTGNINVIVPNTASVYYTYNNTSGGFTLTLKTAAGTGVVLTQTARDIVVCDATNVLEAISAVSSATSFGVGSQGAPSINFIGDASTGLYHPAASQVGVTCGGTVRAIFTTTGMDSQGLRLKNVGSAAALTDAPTVAQVQNGAFITLTGVAGTNTITGSTVAAIAPAAYAAGQITILTPVANNNGPVQVNRDGLGNRSVLLNGFPLIGGEMRTGLELVLIDDGTALNIIGGGVYGQFVVHQLATPAMSVLVDTGRLNTANALVLQPQQTVGGFVATGATQRIDRVVMDIVTGVATRVAGVESGSPAAPAIPGGKRSLCQIGPFTTLTTTITNSMITDERDDVTDYMFAQNVNPIASLLFA